MIYRSNMQRSVAFAQCPSASKKGRRAGVRKAGIHGWKGFSERTGARRGFFLQRGANGEGAAGNCETNRTWVAAFIV